MKKLFCLLALCAAASAHAYSARELLDDCTAADQYYAQNSDTEPSTKATRCIAYLMGIADGYAISDYLAEKVGVKLNAFCLPRDNNLAERLVRATLNHIEHMPPNTTASTATLVASALGKSFSCPDSLESKK